MSAPDEKWRLRFDGCPLALSAHRLWEHVELGQINPFPSITPTSADEPQCYVDIVDGSGPIETLTGHTLADLLGGNRANVPEVCARVARQCRARACAQVADRCRRTAAAIHATARSAKCPRTILADGFCRPASYDGAAQRPS